jgi:hypothetical protein
MIFYLALITCTIYAIIQLIRAFRDFFTFGGKAWQYIALLVLALAVLAVFIIPWIPAIPPVGRRLAVLSWIIVCGALAIVSRICVVLFEASGTSLSRRAEHACNAMLLAAIVGLVITLFSWSFAGLTAYLAKP